MPTIVSTGFITLIDTTDSGGPRNYINPELWVTGTSGSQPGFPYAGAVPAENSIELGIDPYGRTSPLWKMVADITIPNSSDGGWNTDLFPVNQNKTYRFITFFKRGTADGTTYAGLYSNGSTHAVTLAGADDSNPYFWSGDPPVLDRWYMIVGYVHGKDTTLTSSIGGVYDMVTGLKVASCIDFKWKAGTTNAKHRAYYYYCANAGSTQYFWGPRVELCDGLEEKIEDIVAGIASDYQLTQMASDAVITPQEKTSILGRWCALYNDTAATGTLTQTPTVAGRYKTLRDAANALSIWTPTTAGTKAKAFYDAVEALRAYLFTTPAVLLVANWNTNIAITKATWLSLWMTAESAADDLQAAISAKEADVVEALLPRFRGSLSADPASDNRSGDYYYNTSSKKIRAYASGAWSDASIAFTPAGIGADPSGTAAGLVPRFRGSLASDPVSDNRAGDFYYNTTLKKIRAYSGSAWVDASGEFSPTMGPSLYLPLDILSGGLTTDSSGFTRNATVTGATLASGLFGNCLVFDGVDDYALSPAIPITSEISYCVWYKKTTDANMFLIDHRAAEVGCHPIYIDSANMINFYDTVNGSCTSDFAVAKSDGFWHHVVAVGASGYMKLYHDGALVGQVSVGVTPRAATPVTIGTRHTLASWFSGSLDEVKIYQRALTDAEIFAMYQESPEHGYAPGYLGKREGEHPSYHRRGDFWLVYGSTDTPILRGIYVHGNSDIVERVSDSHDKASFYMPMAMDDVVWAVESGFGDYNDYGYGTYFRRLSTAVLIAQKINALLINVGKGVRGGARFDEDGNDLNNGEKGFFLDAQTGQAKLIDALISGVLDAAGGTFSGVVDNESVFKMVPGETAGGAISFSSKTRWSGNDLYNALSVGSSLAVASGTYGAKSITGIAKSSGSVQLREGGTQTVSEAPGWTMSESVTVYFDDPSLRITTVMNASWVLFNAFGLQIRKNGTVIAEVFDNNSVALDKTTSCLSGDTFSLYYKHAWSGSKTLQKMDFWSSSGQKVILQHGTLDFSYIEKGYYATSLSLTTPQSWSSSSNLNYASGAGFATAMASYALGVRKIATGSMTVSGAGKTVEGVARNTVGQATAYFSDGSSQTVHEETAEGCKGGFYNISGSYTLTTQVAENRTVGLAPFDDNLSDIGQDTTRGYPANKRYRDLMLARNAYIGGLLSVLGNISGAAISGTSVTASGDVSGSNVGATQDVSGATLHISGAAYTGILTPSRVNCYYKNSAGFASKSTTSGGTLSFTVYKPILVAVRQSGGSTGQLNALYSGTYYQVKQFGNINNTYVMGTLDPGDYRLVAESGYVLSIYAVGIYGSNDGSVIWS